MAGVLRESRMAGLEERWRLEDSRKLFLGNLPTTDHTERAALRRELEAVGPRTVPGLLVTHLST